MTALRNLLHPRPLVDLPALRRLAAEAQDGRERYWRLARGGR